MPVRNNLKKGFLLARDLREFSHTAACLLTGWCDWDSLHSRKQRVDFLPCSPPFLPLTEFFFLWGGTWPMRMLLPTFWVGLPIAFLIIWKFSHSHAQRCVPQVIPNPVKLPMKTNHHVLVCNLIKVLSNLSLHLNSLINFLK